jgi:hypothetical protein
MSGYDRNDLFMAARSQGGWGKRGAEFVRRFSRAQWTIRSVDLRPQRDSQAVRELTVLKVKNSPER